MTYENETRHITRELISKYKTVLELLEKVEDAMPLKFNHGIIYDQLYILQCLVYAQTKQLEDYLKGEDSDKEIQTNE